MDIIDAGSNSNFLFIDRVSAADKPGTDGTNDGIKVQGGSGGTLEIDQQAADTQIDVLSATDATTFDGSATGTTRRTSSVPHLTIMATGADHTTIKASADYLNLTNALRIETGTRTYDTITLGGGEDSSVTGVMVRTGAGHDVVTVQQDEDADGATTATVDFGAGTGSGSGFGLLNELHVGGAGAHLAVNCTATLAQTGGASHVVVLDDATVGYGGTLIVAEESGLGDVTVNGGATMSVQAQLHVVDDTSTATGLMDIVAGGVVEFTGTSPGSEVARMSLEGTLTLDASADLTVGHIWETGSNGEINAADTAVMYVWSEVDISGTLNVNLTTGLTSKSAVTIEEFDASGTVNVNDGGLLTATTFDVSGTLNVNGGAEVLSLGNSSIATLVIDSGTMTLSDVGPATLVVNNLSITGTGSLDITNNDLIIDYSSSSPLSAVRSYLLAGRGGAGFANATWTGTGGITSSTAADTAVLLADGGLTTAVGYAENSDMFYGSYSTFGGQSVDSTCVLIKYTYGADGNLDGATDGTDLGLVATFYVDPAGDQWFRGDYDYDGACDGSDLTVLGVTYGYSETYGVRLEASTPARMEGEDERTMEQKLEDALAYLLDVLGERDGSVEAAFRAGMALRTDL
jgi:hypothetical protein